MDRQRTWAAVPGGWRGDQGGPDVYSRGGVWAEALAQRPLAGHFPSAPVYGTQSIAGTPAPGLPELRYVHTAQQQQES